MNDEWSSCRFKKIIYTQLKRVPHHLIVAVLLPTAAIEIIHNIEQLKDKINNYINQYDDEFKLKANPAVQIIDYMIV